MFGLYDWLTASIEILALEAEFAVTSIPEEDTVRNYYELRQQIAEYTKDMRNVINHPNYCLQFMQPGRLVRIKYNEFDFGWASVVKFTQRKQARGSTEEMTAQQSYILDVVLLVAEGSSVGTKTHLDLPPGIRPPQKGEKGVMEVVPVLMSCIDAISHIRLHLPADLRSADQRRSVKRAMEEVHKNFPDGPAILDPITNMQITDTSFKNLLRVSPLTMALFATLIILENRGTRKKLTRESPERGPSSTRSLQSVCRQGGNLQEDPNLEEGLQSRKLHPPTGRTQMPKTRPSQIWLHQRSRSRAAQGASGVRNQHWR